jgi:hypothetical protein
MGRQARDDYTYDSDGTTNGPCKSPMSKEVEVRQGLVKVYQRCRNTFAEYGCASGLVRVLIQPSLSRCLRPTSTFCAREDPISRGKCGNCCASQINYIHPMTPGAGDFKYQVWPNDYTCDWIRKHGPRLPGYIKLQQGSFTMLESTSYFVEHTQTLEGQAKLKTYRYASARY